MGANPQIVLQLKDHDRFSSNDLVGVVRLNLLEAVLLDWGAPRLATPPPKWHRVHTLDGQETSGELLLCVELMRKPTPSSTVGCVGCLLNGC